MGLEKLSSRACIGMFYEALAQNAGVAWVNEIATEPFPSDQASEEYPWLGMVPVMREWVGGLNEKQLRALSITIFNKEYEATLGILIKDLRRDKTGQIKLRLQELADRTNSHWASLLSTLVLNAEALVCYDGDYFFGTAHAEGGSGTQSNLLSIDISELATGGAGTHGSTTVPSVGEMSLCIQQAIQQIMGFKDDQGEPFNEDARKFRIMAGTNLMGPINGALGNQFLPSGMENTLVRVNGRDFEVTASYNPRLTTLTTKFDVYRTDGRTKAFIRQEEVAPELHVIAEGSEQETKEKRHTYSVYASRNVGLGRWQHACRVSMI